MQKGIQRGIWEGLEEREYGNYVMYIIISKYIIMDICSNGYLLYRHLPVYRKNRFIYSKNRFTQRLARDPKLNFRLVEFFDNKLFKKFCPNVSQSEHNFT